MECPADRNFTNRNKSDSIEPINTDEKNIWKIWKDLEDFSAKPTGRECASRHRNLTNRNKSNK